MFPGPSPGARTSAGDTVHVVNLAFDVLRVEMPIDGARNSPKVWNHVDELRLDSDLVARLARNGLRVGVASSASWSAIRTILEAGRARTQKDQMLPQPGTPLVIELAAIQESESIFSYGRDNRLVGKTFPAGQKTVQLDYAFHPHLGGCTDLEVGFEVRNDRGEMTWERRDGEIRQVPAYDRHVFENLRAALTLKPGEFLVVSPGDQADNEYLIGSRFLMHSASGERSETLLFITPQPFQSPSAHRRP
ncbi:MAG: hypothetical protein V1790_09220 [Planctomycetota bacterium]